MSRPPPSSSSAPVSLNTLAEPAPWEQNRTGKKKQADDSAGREERAGTVAMVAELITCDAHDPRRLVRQGQWQNLMFWSHRALALGGLLTVLGLTESFDLLALIGASLPLVATFTLGAHLDQFRGDRPLSHRDQLARWLPKVAEMAPAYLVYLLLYVALAVLVSFGGSELVAPVLALGTALALAWTCTLSEGVLLEARGSDAISQGFRQSLRVLLLWPVNTLIWATTFRRSGPSPSGEPHLLSTAVGGLFGVYLMAGLGSLLVTMLAMYVSPHLRDFVGWLGVWGVTAASALVAESSMGLWVHHYLATSARTNHATQIEAAQAQEQN